MLQRIRRIPRIPRTRLISPELGVIVVMGISFHTGGQIYKFTHNRKNI